MEKKNIISSKKIIRISINNTENKILKIFKLFGINETEKKEEKER